MLAQVKLHLQLIKYFNSFVFSYTAPASESEKYEIKWNFHHQFIRFAFFLVQSHCSQFRNSVWKFIFSSLALKCFGFQIRFQNLSRIFHLPIDENSSINIAHMICVQERPWMNLCVFYSICKNLNNCTIVKFFFHFRHAEITEFSLQFRYPECSF